MPAVTILILETKGSGAHSCFRVERYLSKALFCPFMTNQKVKVKMQAGSMKSKRETKKKEIEELEKELEKLRDVLEAISIERFVKHVREDRESS